MNAKRTVSSLLIFVLLFVSSFAFAETDYATRGQVADMLLNAADFYNPGVLRSDIIKGYEDGQLHEDWRVTRAEALVMLSRAFGEFPPLTGHNKRTALLSGDFNDIPAWAEKELAPIFDSGLVAGVSEGVFAPDSKVTVNQMNLFISRVYSLYGTNPADDFYATINKEELDNMHIEEGNAVAGTLTDMQRNAHSQISGIITSTLQGNHGKNTPEGKIAALYNTVTDIKSRNEEGIKPIKKYLDMIDNVKNIGELTILHNTLSEELCVQVFLGFSLTNDIEDSNSYMLYLDVIEPFMNKGIYSENSKETEAYLEYLKTILILSGEDETTAEKNARLYFEFEAELAKTATSPNEAVAISKGRNVFSYNKVSALFPDYDLEKVLEGCALEKSDRILVPDIALTEKFAEMYNLANIDTLKVAAKISVLTSWGTVLNEEFCKAESTLSEVLFGTTGSFSIRQSAIQTIETVMPEYLGRLYVEKYFDEESKDGVEKIAYDIIETYKSRICNISWMSEETKHCAIEKLDAIGVKIGYPDTFETYLDKVEILSPKEGGTYFGNMLQIKKAAIKHYGSMQNMSADRNSWILYPYTVNACYEVSTNDITFPAAILQAPLYDKNASYEENLGGIGYIIAHEVSHAFDSIGSQYDENGNFNDWWTEKDRDAFDNICKETVEFFQGYEAISGIPTDGQLTLNENIADMGAVACITQLAGEKGNGDYKKLYTKMAEAWAETRTREYAKYAMQTDFHSDPKVRINRVLVNFEEFYNAFDIKAGDGMYVAPENRLSIW